VIEGVHIWHTVLDEAGWPGPEGLPGFERKRFEAFLREEPARRWLASRWALRRVLEGYLAKTAAAIELEVTEGGKPRLRGGGLEFNLSHSGGLALVAVAGCEVGVDVERIRPKRPAPFYVAWTRHEARLKCLGTGFGAPPDEAPVAVKSLAIAPEYAAAVAVAGAEVGPVLCRPLLATDRPFGLGEVPRPER
jgi:phosphopantetheinyl transferase